jgi:hypothetical protein
MTNEDKIIFRKRIEPQIIICEVNDGPTRVMVTGMLNGQHAKALYNINEHMLWQRQAVHEAVIQRLVNWAYENEGV